MTNFHEDETPTTPLITWNPTDGLLSIVGRSIDEDADGFFDPLEDEIKQYATNPGKSTRVIIALEYMNTQTVGDLCRMLKHLVAGCRMNEAYLEIKWHYEDVDSGQEDVILMIEKVIDFRIDREPYTDE